MPVALFSALSYTFQLDSLSLALPGGPIKSPRAHVILQSSETAAVQQNPADRLQSSPNHHFWLGRKPFHRIHQRATSVLMFDMCVVARPWFRMLAELASPPRWFGLLRAHLYPRTRAVPRSPVEHYK